MIGIVLLAGYWLQGPLALLVFSNKVLLKPGSTPRLWFLKGHVIAGKGLNMLGLIVIILGILAFEVKRPQKLPALESREKKGGGSSGLNGLTASCSPPCVPGINGNIAGGK